MQPQLGMRVTATDIEKDVEAWSEVQYPVLDQFYNIQDSDYSMRVGLFGYDIQDRIWGCDGDVDCAENYNSYDGWSMGAFMQQDYTTALVDYTAFGACWQDGNCWGAWLKYSNGEYYSQEISFRTDQALTTSTLILAQQEPSEETKQLYQNNMYAYYDRNFESIWYSLEVGTIFSRWMPNRKENQKSAFENGD